MQDFVWRSRARVVAILDIVFTVIEVLLFIVLAIVFGSKHLNAESMISTYGQDFESNHDQRAFGTAVYWIVGVILILSLAVFGIQLAAAVALLKAGRTEQDPKESLRSALVWRNVTIVCLMLTIFGQFFALNRWSLVSSLMWKGISLFVVCQFTNEIQSFLKSERYNENIQLDNVNVQKKHNFTYMNTAGEMK